MHVFGVSAILKVLPLTGFHIWPFAAELKRWASHPPAPPTLMPRKVHLMAVPGPGSRVLMRVGRELTLDQLADYERDLEYLAEYDYSLELLPIVRANGNDALQVIEAVCTREFDDMLFPHTRRDATVEVNRVILNFLSAMRLFLDHVQTRVTRRFGSGSEVLSAYRRITARIHDSSQSYRVLYNLRNFVQHCGMPVREVMVEDSAERGKRVAVECLSKDLLDRFDDWRFARKDLEALAPTFAIAPMIREVVGQLQEIHEELRAVELEEIRAAAKRIVSVLLEAAGADPQGAVVEVISDTAANQTQFRFLTPPERLLEQLGFNVRRIARV